MAFLRVEHPPTQETYHKKRMSFVFSDYKDITNLKGYCSLCFQENREKIDEKTGQIIDERDGEEAARKAGERITYRQDEPSNDHFSIIFDTPAKTQLSNKLPKFYSITFEKWNASSNPKFSVDDLTKICDLINKHVPAYILAMGAKASLEQLNAIEKDPQCTLTVHDLKNPLSAGDRHPSGSGMFIS